MPDLTWTVHLDLILLLAVALIAPLGLRLTAQPNRQGESPPLYKLMIRAHIPAALMVGAAFLLPLGTLSAALTLPWLTVTIIAALYGLYRLLPRGYVAVDELCFDVGLIYLAVGGVWLTAARTGLSFMGYGTLTATLTATHFHIISLSALVMIGMAGRWLRSHSPRGWKLVQLPAQLMIAAPMLLAVAMTFSFFLEAILAVVLALSLTVVSLLVLIYIVPKIERRLARLLLAISSLSALVTMTLASLYALRYVTGWELSIPFMVETHGWLNTLGFALCGLIAWTLIAPPSSLPAPGIPFSRLSSRGGVGAGFFERVGLIDEAKPIPLGIVDNLEDYRRPDFNPDVINPQVRAFYEQTGTHRLLVAPVWTPFFLPMARLYKRWFSSHIEQMNFPLVAESTEDRITSRIVPLRDDLDRRTRVRGWVRTYDQTGAAVYVAAYANHAHHDQVYMNIAFPLPGGNLTSILRLEMMPCSQETNGVLLTSLNSRETPGDQGVYFVTGWLAVRLPINETIRVYPPHGFKPPREFALRWQGCPFAIHEMWLLGVKFLTLYYSMEPLTVQTDTRL